jgi:hypothetical protein
MKKMTPTPRKKAAAPKTPSTTAPSSSASMPPQTSVAARAYELFIQRGGQHGRDREDWLIAERELLPEASAEG